MKSLGDLQMMQTLAMIREFDKAKKDGDFIKAAKIARANPDVFGPDVEEAEEC